MLISLLSLLNNADCLEAILELDAACKVKKCSDEAALLFGIEAAALVGEQIQKASAGIGGWLCFEEGCARAEEGLQPLVAGSMHLA